MLETLKIFFFVGFFCSFVVINDCVQRLGPKQRSVHSKKSEKQVLIAWKTPAGLNVCGQPHLGVGVDVPDQPHLGPRPDPI